MWVESKVLFGIVVIMTIQSAFCIEMDQNEFFLFLKKFILTLPH
jgi:hypothetical protein